MRELFQRVFRRSAHAKWRSNAELLSRVLPRAVAKRLLSECSDKRLLVQLAARAAGRAEREIVAELALAHGIPVAPEVRPVCLPVLKLPLGLEDLRRYGAVPVVEGPIVEGKFASGVIVVDPGLAEPLRKALGVQACYLGSWFDIARALDQSEELIAAYGTSSAKESQSIGQELGASILKVLCEDVNGYGASSFEFRAVGGKGEYQFKTLSGALASGAIDGRVLPHIIVYLGELSRGLRKPEEPIVGVARLSEEEFRVTLCIEQREQAPINTVPNVAESSGSKNLEKKSIGEGPELASRSKVVPFRDRARRDESTVLVVEDSPTFGGVVCRFLERKGMKALRCSDGAEAIRLLSEQAIRPDAIICDVHMPRLGGEEFVSRLQTLFPAGSRPPIIAVSSDVEVETELAMLSAGADLFLSKTIDPRILCAYVEKFLGKSIKTTGRERAC